MRKKSLIVMLVIMALAVVTLTSCGSKGDQADSKYVGTWKITNISMGDESDSFDKNWTITLNADGTGVTESEGVKEDLTWELTDGGFKTKGGIKATFKDDGDNITTKILGATLTFEKQ